MPEAQQSLSDFYAWREEEKQQTMVSGLLLGWSTGGVDVNHQLVLGFYLIPLFDRSTDAECFIGWTHLLEKLTSHYGLLLIFAGNSMDRPYPKKEKRQT